MPLWTKALVFVVALAAGVAGFALSAAQPVAEEVGGVPAATVGAVDPGKASGNAIGDRVPVPDLDVEEAAGVVFKADDPLNSIAPGDQTKFTPSKIDGNITVIDVVKAK